MKKSMIQLNGIEGSNLVTTFQQQKHCSPSPQNHPFFKQTYSFQSEMFPPSAMDGNGENELILKQFESDILPQKLDDILKNGSQTSDQTISTGR
jgi:hypothetical protein